MNKKLYSYDLNDRVNDQLPQCVKLAMNNSGWNAFGIYELVLAEIEKGEVLTTQANCKEGNEK